MLLTVEGFTKKATEELAEATLFFANQLMDPRMVKNLTIDIEKNTSLDAQAFCVNEDHTRNPRWFTIELRAHKNDDNLIKTLAHEMVHVKQYARNELYSPWKVKVLRGKSSGTINVWQGSVWEPKSKEHAYWDAPWEVEAFGREVGLFHKWNIMKSS